MQVNYASSSTSLGRHSWLVVSMVITFVIVVQMHKCSASITPSESLQKRNLFTPVPDH